MKTYRVTRWYLSLSYSFLILTTAICLYLLFLNVVRDYLNYSPLVLWALYILFDWYIQLMESNAIVLQANGSIIFRSLIRKVTVSPSDITSIKPFPDRLFRPTLIIKSAAGRIYIAKDLVGLDDFLDEVKSLNPNIEVSV